MPADVFWPLFFFMFRPAWRVTSMFITASGFQKSVAGMSTIVKFLSKTGSGSEAGPVQKTGSGLEAGPVQKAHALTAAQVITTSAHRGTKEVSLTDSRASEDWVQDHSEGKRSSQKYLNQQPLLRGRRDAGV
jgi:hypothetical protein